MGYITTGPLLKKQTKKANIEFVIGMPVVQWAVFICDKI